eukprot:3672207-Amphidinium_carterae.1
MQHNLHGCGSSGFPPQRAKYSMRTPSGTQKPSQHSQHLGRRFTSPAAKQHGRVKDGLVTCYLLLEF